jgi:hypothetical protein
MAARCARAASRACHNPVHLDGTRHELSRAEVEARLSDVLPELVRKHAVRVNDIWFPVIQAFVTATGIPLSSSRTPLGVTWLRLDSKSAERSTHARRTLAQPSERECLRRPHGAPRPPTPPSTRPGTRRRTSRPPSSLPLPVRAGGFVRGQDRHQGARHRCAALVSRTPTIRRPALRTRLDLRRSGFLAGAAVGHHLGAIILVSSAWTSPVALAWSLPSRSSRLAHLGWMAASLVITQTETASADDPHVPRP